MGLCMGNLINLVQDLDVCHFQGCMYTHDLHPFSGCLAGAQENKIANEKFVA